jgi:hypothetical protein
LGFGFASSPTYAGLRKHMSSRAKHITLSSGHGCNTDSPAWASLHGKQAWFGDHVEKKLIRFVQPERSPQRDLALFRFFKGFAASVLPYRILCRRAGVSPLSG